ncbi:MAG: hypothetical protein AAFO80_16315, partial [Pseudomonadota bacterium]
MGRVGALVRGAAPFLVPGGAPGLVFEFVDGLCTLDVTADEGPTATSMPPLPEPEQIPAPEP